MIQSSTLQFLKDLRKNNNKSWFDANRKRYDQAKEDFISQVEKIIAGIGQFDTPVAALKAKDCMFRINRDVRFSKDKSPYKVNIAAYFNRNGKKAAGAGYYMHIEPGNSFVGGGIWMPEPKELGQIRQEIDYNFDAWKKIMNNAAFKKAFPKSVEGEALTRPPKGYDDSNPAIEYIKKKSFVVMHQFTDKEVLDKAFIKNVLQVFKAMKPLVDFINAGTE
ncbi:MAG: DUF2461 domain-containing protein [Bacteroidetes bacterium]|nr:DUF2461 domain-containing protein [Bacteroidota bacterium]